MALVEAGSFEVRPFEAGATLWGSPPCAGAPASAGWEHLCKQPVLALVLETCDERGERKRTAAEVSKSD
jgi:hypothetical protein